MQPLGKDFRDLLRLLDEHAVRCLIVGGFAVAAHVPRFTKDLTSGVAWVRENATRLGAATELGFGSLNQRYEPNRVDLLT